MNPNPLSLEATLSVVIQRLGEAGFTDAAFEARQLAQDCLNLTFTQILTQGDRILTEAEIQTITTWTTERARGVPLAYLSRRKGFYKYDFVVEPGLLVPRPESEMVVETAIRRSEEMKTMERLADLGTGTGCIGLSLTLEFSEANLWAVDRDPLALAVTNRNAEVLGVRDRVTTINATLPKWDPGRPFDVVVANPPYIAVNDPGVEGSVRAFEPSHALFAGEEGFGALREWATWSSAHLKKDGLFVCEFGASQGRLMHEMLVRLGFVDLQMERDLAGHDRVVSARKKIPK